MGIGFEPADLEPVVEAVEEIVGLAEIG